METGLVCVFSPNPGARTPIDAMAAQLAPIDGARFDRLDAAPLALHMRISPWADRPFARDANSGVALLLLGRAWQGEKTIPAEALLEAFLRDGGRALTQLGGAFTILVWTPRTETLTLVTDRLAAKKLYVWRAGDTTLLASELDALLGHPAVPRVIDEAAVEQFLVTSHLVDTRSLVRDVRVLEPATIARVDRDGVASERYWTPRITAGPDDGLDAWADRLAEALAPAVRARCTEAPMLLPLSGGLDARSVAAFIPPRWAAQADAVSFGHSHCHDVRYGRRIAGALGAPFKRLAIADDFFRTDLEIVQRLCDGEVSIEALPMYRLNGVGTPGQTMLTGFLGDALSGGHLLGLNGTESNDIALDLIWRKKYQAKGFSEAQLDRVIRTEHYGAARGSTRALMQTALAEAEADTLDEKALLVELHHRQSRYITYFGRLLSSRYRVENPFLDVDVLDTFLAMPLVHRRNQRAYRRMLVRHAPRLATIPENKTGRPVRDTDARGLPAAPAKKPLPLPAPLQWRLNRARVRLGQWLVSASGGWLGPHNRNDYVHHDESIRQVAPDWFRTKLLDSPFAADWFNRDALAHLLEEHLARKQDHSVRINNAVAFVAWREARDI
ncbi:MAG TPA: asparagine synthase-related protein [Thiobacillaceae bacterium]|nr:asparagine synthase-related protein [Thiobacillaceae bacterium]